MADEQITVKIAADASGVKPAVDQARGAMLSFGAGANTTQAQLALVRDGFRQTAGEAASARIAFTTLSPAAAQLRPALDGAGGSAGHTKDALRGLISEVGEVGKSFIEGVDPLTIFAQHGLQVTGAIAGMMRGGAGIVAFLEGPWGLALTTAVGLLGALWAKHAEAGEAERKQQEAAGGLTDAIRDLNAQTDKDIQSSQQAAQAHVATAEALERQARSIAANTRARLNAADVEERLTKRGADAALAAGGDPDAVGIMQILAGRAGQKTQLLRDQHSEDLERILSAQDAQRMAKIPIIQEQVRRATDATAAAYGRFSDAVEKLNAKMKVNLTNPTGYTEEYKKLLSIRDAALRRIAQQNLPARAPGPPAPTPTGGTRQKIAAASDRTSGEETGDFKASQDRIVQIAHAAAEERRQIDAQTADALRQRQLDALTDAESTAKFQVALGIATNDQLLAEQARFEEKRHTLQMAPLLKDRDQAKEDGSDLVRLGALNNQIEAADRQHQQKMTDIQRQRVLERTQIERQAIASTASLWGQNIAKLATLQQGFGATLRGIYSGMVDIVSTALGQMLQKWITTELSKTAAALFGIGARTGAETTGAAVTTGISAMTAVKQIAHSAAVAAARVWAAVSALPGGFIIAPALAAATLFGVIKLGQSIFSARDGIGTVPYDNAPFLLHRNEMVLPANLASPLRAMLQGGSAANGNAPFAANEAGGHSFHYNDYTEKGQSDAQIMAKRMVFAKAMRQAYREGAFSGTPLAF